MGPSVISDPHVREHLIDGAKASPVVAYGVAWFNGFDWGAVGTFFMAIYAVLLVLDKLGLLPPLKRLGTGLVSRFRHKPPPPVVRHPEDE